MSRICTQKVATVTITIASPAVVSLTAHGLVEGNLVVFTTTGALPTGITAGSLYYVMSAGLTADAFQITATSGSATAVNTSGTQSGTHTVTAYYQYVEAGSNASVTAAPITLSAWVKGNGSAVPGGTAVALVDPTTTNNYFILSCEAGKPAAIARSSIVAPQFATATTTLTAGSWWHICAKFSSDSSRSIFVNGVSEATNTVTCVPNNVARTSIGRLGRSVPSLYASATIAHAAIWNLALTDLEVAALAGGADPRTIQSSGLVNYVPMTNNASPETDTQQSGFTFTVYGAAFNADNTVSGRNPYVRRNVSQALVRSATR